MIRLPALVAGFAIEVQVERQDQPCSMNDSDAAIIDIRWSQSASIADWEFEPGNRT